MLALVHISSRYHVGKVLDEAREVFEPTVAPSDFDLIELPFPERGNPSWCKRSEERGSVLTSTSFRAKRRRRDRWVPPPGTAEGDPAPKGHQISPPKAVIGTPETTPTCPATATLSAVL